MNLYRENRDWADAHTDAAKLAIAPYIIQVASEYKDRKEVTDLVVRDLAISLRHRRFKSAGKFDRDFTIRTSTRGGGASEFRKILEGNGDVFFYGILEKTGPEYHSYFLGDLDVFREYAFKRREITGYWPGAVRYNRDRNDNTFKVFNVTHLPANFILQIKHPQLTKVGDKLMDRCGFNGPQIDLFNPHGKELSHG